jgi:hypothetical protein
VTKAGLRDQVDRLQPNPVRPAEETGVGERPPALQGDVIRHDASLNSAQLVDNMPRDQRPDIDNCACPQELVRQIADVYAFHQGCGCDQSAQEPPPDPGYVTG